MRIDKYLKVSRLIKRRTVANDACDSGRVKANDRVIKASYEVAVDDVIEIRFVGNTIRVRVTAISEHALKADAKQMYEII